MKFILGTKQGMVQIYNEGGRAIPATVIEAGPVVVTQIKTKSKDGYDGVQIGFGVRKFKNISKAVRGHLQSVFGADTTRGFATLREVPLAVATETGATFDVSVFTEGDTVQVSGISKGKGFQGVVKRHGFHGGPRSHGQKHSEREPGSIGTSGAQRVFKGMRMAGRMGTDRTTVKNLTVVRVDKGNNQILVSGAVPGRRGTLLEIKGRW